MRIFQVIAAALLPQAHSDIMLRLGGIHHQGPRKTPHRSNTGVAQAKRQKRKGKRK